MFEPSLISSIVSPRVVPDGSPPLPLRTAGAIRSLRKQDHAGRFSRNPIGWYLGFDRMIITNEEADIIAQIGDLLHARRRFSQGITEQLVCDKRQAVCVRRLR